MIARRAGWLPGLFAVERASRGELYFPLAVFVLFAVGRGQPVFYAISLLTLVVCDALAAVAGRAWGAHPYLVTSEKKSLEGSAAFLLTAFLAIALPLRFAAGMATAPALMIAVQLALLLAAFEAISAGGYDNLVVPLMTFYLLLKLTENTAEGIALQLLAQLVLLGAMLLVSRRTGFITFSGALAAHLVLYAAFSLGNPLWTIAPALTLLGFLALDARRAETPAARGHHVRALFHACIVATVVLFVDNALSWPRLGAPAWGAGRPLAAVWVGALAAPLALAIRNALALVGKSGPRDVALAGLAAWAWVAPAGLFAVRGAALKLPDLGISALLVALALGAHALLPRRPGELRELSQSVALATLLVAPLALWVVA